MTGLSAADKAEMSLRIVREAKELSYDTETSGLDWRKNFPVGYVVGDGAATVVYVPVRHGGGGNLAGSPTPKGPTEPFKPSQYEKALAKAFKERRAKPRDQGLIVGHHIKFDAHFSARAGIMLGRNLSDTQNNEAMLDEYARSYSLDACAERHGVTAKKGDELYQRLATLFGGPATRDSMEHFWKIAGDDPVAVEYAEGDGVSTYELFEVQRPKILAEDMGYIWDIENRLIWTLFRMESRGIKLDMDYLKQLPKIIGTKVEAAKAVLPKDLNVRSGPQMHKYILSTGHTDWPTTEQGNPSFPEKWLKTFPEGKAIVELRKWTTLENSFVTPMIERHSFEGRVHTHLNQLKADDVGVVSGRLSSSEPNLTQIPKRDKEIAKLFRKLFLPDDGMSFYEADWSQCEPRLYAHYSQDPSLLAGYNAKPFRDVHDVVAKMLNVERDPTAKRMNMGIFTGMYPKTFSEHMGWDIARATEQWKLWHSQFPDIKEFQDDAKDALIEREYVRTILKRRAHLESSRLAYKAASKIIQGGNADLLKYMMVTQDEQLEAEGDETQLLMTVHDAFEFQTPDTPKGHARMDRVLEELVDVQKPPFNLRVPFVVEADHGKNWAEGSFGPEENWK